MFEIFEILGPDRLGQEYFSRGAESGVNGFLSKHAVRTAWLRFPIYVKLDGGW
jgi:hypothetical protein